ncbi:MAG: hypothetical protein KC646_16695 [Candidatus Cloacimonetes bacterium]|nr:hypothetical protein [Candidatus Cloacimonadota bacterium]
MKNLYIIIILLMFVTNIQASNFQTFQYGFTFTDSTGQPLRLNRFLAQVKFSLFRDQTNANPVSDVIRYQESFQNVEVKDGFMEIKVGTAGLDGSGTPITEFPDLSDSSWVQIEIIIDLGDTPIVMTPRVQLPVVPMAFFVNQANQVGTLTEEGIRIFTQGAINDLRNELRADQQFIKNDTSNTITSNFTFDNNQSNTRGNIQFNSLSDTGYANTTRLAIVLDPASSPNTTFSVKNNGDLYAKNIAGDGAAITQVVHTFGDQTISGRKTFSEKLQVNTTVEATMFKGNGQQLTNVLISNCGTIPCPAQNVVSKVEFMDDIVTPRASVQGILTVTGDIVMEGTNTSLVYRPITAPNASVKSIDVRSGNNDTIFSVSALGHLTAVDIVSQNITATSFIGDGNSITNLKVITSSLQSNSVTNGAIIQDAINSIKILNQTILSEDIGTSQITTSNIALNAVTSGKISGDIRLYETLTIDKQISKDSNNQFLGTLNFTHVNLGSNSQTGTSTQNAQYVSVAGGRYNTALASYSFVGGGSKNQTDGTFSNISGGFQNKTIDNYSSISGGMNNITSGTYSTILGGLNNRTNSPAASIVGGADNIAHNSYSSTVGGRFLTATGNYSFIGAGMNNTTTATVSAAIGGQHNYVGGVGSTIIGGKSNKNFQNYSSVVAGQYNTNSGQNSIILAGKNNKINSNYTMISAGSSNMSTGHYSGIIGGMSNMLGGNYSSLIGGHNNYAQGNNSAVLLGHHNSTISSNSLIFNGSYNKTKGTSSSILFGSNINIDGTNVVAIGSNSKSMSIQQSDTFIIDSLNVGINTTTPQAVLTLMSTTSINPLAVLSTAANSEPFFILTTSGRVGVNTTQPTFDMEVLGSLKVQTIILADGSSRNAFSPTSGAFTNFGSKATYNSNIGIGITSTFNFTPMLLVNGAISADAENSLYGTTQSHINLGRNSTVGTTSQITSYISISGGFYNTAEATLSFIGGGQRNMTLATGSSVVGGSYNTAAAIYSTILGGQYNKAYGHHSAISGGYANYTSHPYSFIGAGMGNTTLTSYSSIGSGWYNTAAGWGSHISNGRQNSTIGMYNHVSNGQQNIVSGNYSSIINGLHNTATASYNLIANGYNNQVNGVGSAIYSGHHNLVTGQYSSILGGRNLTMSANYSIGFNASTTHYQISNNSVAAFMGVSMGIRTTQPTEALDVNGTIKGINLNLTGSISTDPLNKLLGAQSKTHVNLGDNSQTGRTGNDVVYAIVSGGNNNEASHDYAIVAGGLNNIAGNTHAVVSGGKSNSASGTYSNIGGGDTNIATANYSTIAGGQSNISASLNGFIGGGLNNNINGNFSSISSGQANIVTGIYSAILAGSNQRVNANYGGIAFGHTNQVLANYSSIHAGHHNTSTMSYGAILGGSYNKSIASSALILLGDYNWANGMYSSVSNGHHNTAGANYSSVDGGHWNTAAANYANVANGHNNYALGAYSSVANGKWNTAANNYSHIYGGSVNEVTQTSSTILSGDLNKISGTFSQIIGGRENNTSGAYTFISGHKNTITANYASIASGQYNTNIAIYGVIGGGKNNHVGGNYGHVGGGFNGSALGIYSNVSGGNYSRALGDYSSVGGGLSNTAAGAYSVIAGGQQNHITGDRSSILGGKNLMITGNDSMGYNGSGTPLTISQANTFSLLGMKVGIGTTSPIRNFSVKDPAKTTATLSVDVASDKIGVRTTNPSVELEVVGTIKATNLVGSGTGIVFGSVQQFNAVSASAHLTAVGYISAAHDNIAHGNKIHTHINLGDSGITGTSGQNKEYVSIFGGQYNTATANFSTIIGSKNSSVNGEYSMILGGTKNSVGGLTTTNAMILAGNGNSITEKDNSIYTGNDNTMAAQNNVIINADSSTITGTNNVLIGGSNTTISNNNNLVFKADATAKTLTGSNMVRFIGTGIKVGVGVDLPTEALDVSGSVQATSFKGSASDLTFPATLSLTNIAFSGSISADAGNSLLGGSSATQVNLGRASTTNNNYSSVSGGHNNTASADYSAVLGGRNNQVSGDDSTILGGKNLIITGNNSIGFGSSGASVTVSDSNAAVFPDSKMGVGTFTPQSRLQVAGGGLCVGTDTQCSGKNTAGTIYANNTTVQAADYSEYFEREGRELLAGEVVGISRLTGKTKLYESGDILLGVITTSPGVLGNSEADPNTSAMVALMGQVPFSKSQTITRSGLVYTLDHKLLGYLLSSGNLYLNIASNNQNDTLNKKVKDLENIIDQQQKLIEAILKKVN